MDYSIRLEQFEGPLDLLLHLIEKQKVAIEDVFVSQITEQYLACIEGISLDMESASEFIVMATKLLYIKSKSLLPASSKIDDEEDQENTEQEIIRRLHEYKIYKELSLTLRTYENSASGRFFKLPEELVFNKPDLILKDADSNMLFDAFINILQKKPRIAPKQEIREIAREKVTLDSRIKYILCVLSQKDKILFEDLFIDNVSTDLFIVTFLALLELIHQSKCIALQDGLGEDIWIVKNNKIGESLADGTN